MFRGLRRGITKDDALAVFHRRYPPHVVKDWSEATDTLPPNCHPFRRAPFDDCWFVLFALDGPPVLQSSRLVAVSKGAGKVVYDGVANDEG